MEPKCFQVYVVTDSGEEARKLLRTVVGERLTVSAKVLGPVTSLVWDNGIQECADKWIATAVATRGRLHDLTRRIQELHPDKNAEILALPVVAGNRQYLDWVMARSW
jgi:periplasmic divalent cation tolerance protein